MKPICWPPRFLPAAIALVVALAGCSRSEDGLLQAEAAAPLFEELHQEAIRMVDVASLTGEAGLGSDPPFGAERIMEQLGTLAKQVVDTVRPPDATGALDALERATRDAMLTAGGHQESPDRVTIGNVIVRLTPDQATRAREGLEEERTTQERREQLRRRLEDAVRRLIYASLLADLNAQAAFAPRMSPSDLPPELPRRGPTGGVDPLLGAFDSVDEWRDQLFEDNRFVVPDPNADGIAWRALLAWVLYVNPDLAGVSDQLHNVFNRHFYQ